MHKLFTPRFPVRQHGSTLVVAMLILVLIMMIGVAAISTSNSGYKIAGNIQFEDSALNSAEAAVAAGEQWLTTGSNFDSADFTSTRSAGKLWIADSNTPLTRTWDDTDSLPVNGDASRRYNIQLLSVQSVMQGSNVVINPNLSSVCNKVNTYLVTGRATFARGATKIIQSYYSVLNC